MNDIIKCCDALAAGRQLLHILSTLPGMPPASRGIMSLCQQLFKVALENEHKIFTVIRLTSGNWRPACCTLVLN